LPTASRTVAPAALPRGHATAFPKGFLASLGLTSHAVQRRIRVVGRPSRGRRPKARSSVGYRNSSDALSVAQPARHDGPGGGGVDPVAVFDSRRCSSARASSTASPAGSAGSTSSAAGCCGPDRRTAVGSYRYPATSRARARQAVAWWSACGRAGAARPGRVAARARDLPRRRHRGPRLRPGTGPPLRSSDAKADRAGRLWLGTMACDATPGAGALDSTPAQQSVEVLEVTVSNGLGWSPDGRVMYYVDTNPPGGHSSTTRTPARSGAARSSIDAGFPDGLCVDADGGIWVALRRVARSALPGRPDGQGHPGTDPAGHLVRVRRIRLPDVARHHRCGRPAAGRAYGAPCLCHTPMMPSACRSTAMPADRREESEHARLPGDRGERQPVELPAGSRSSECSGTGLVSTQLPISKVRGRRPAASCATGGAQARMGGSRGDGGAGVTGLEPGTPRW
jgi:hypothetical protein